MKNTENYIKNWSNPFLPLTPESRYWTGYIFADGHIIYNSGQAYSISLFSKDKEILLKFKNFIGEAAKMYERPTGIGQVTYNSKPTTEWFMTTFNIPVKKALTLDPSTEIDWDLLHGYFDGDGCVRLSKSRGRWNRYEAKFTTGSKIWAERIQAFLREEGISSYIRAKGNAYDINIGGKVNLYYMYSKMYASNTSKLEYKYNKFVALFSNEH